jgi:hypothetical protein
MKSFIHKHWGILGSVIVIVFALSATMLSWWPKPEEDSNPLYQIDLTDVPLHFRHLPYEHWKRVEIEEPKVGEDWTISHIPVYDFTCEGGNVRTYLEHTLDPNYPVAYRFEITEVTASYLDCFFEIQ